MKNILTILMLSLLAASCTTSPSGIGTHVNTCCPSASYESFTVTTTDIPAFLGPLMQSNFSVAFANHGLQPVTEEGDLAVELKYVQENLSVPVEGDTFDEHIASGDSLRFVARIVINIREKDSDDIIWSGHIQRIHDVGPGEYMHTGVASIALLDAFTEVLKGFPGSN
ncbi:MAG: hypothetical protein KDI36_17315 [Pseudomonadales bacterium]|nr:hypothetical protein [Pseudomonadales bacterium]